MENEVKKYVFDAFSALEQIEKYFLTCPNFSSYDSQPMLQDATERNLEIIGEAIKKALDVNPNIEITNSRRIVNTRNKLIHGYDSVDNTEVYAIVIKHLPLLKQELSRILQ